MPGSKKDYDYGQRQNGSGLTGTTGSGSGSGEYTTSGSDEVIKVGGARHGPGAPQARRDDSKNILNAENVDDLENRLVRFASKNEESRDSEMMERFQRN